MSKENTGPAGIPERVTAEMLEGMDLKSVEYCQIEGNRYIDGQIRTGEEIRAKALAFLGMLAAAIITLSGFAVLLISRGEYYTMIFFLSLYALLALSMVAGCLIRGIIYERPYKIAGNKPTYILCDSALAYARKKQQEGGFYKQLLGVHLNTLVEKIEFNKKENERMQQCFRHCVKLACTFVLLALPVILAYWIIR